VSTYARLADLPLEIESYELEGRQLQPVPEFTRHTTVIHLQGGGEEGVGEDVVYEPPDHEGFQAAGPVLPLAGSWTIQSFAEHPATLDLFPTGPTRPDSSPLYRTWAFESAALDLALRQAGRSLADHLGREPRPVTFVVSLRLGEPPTLDPVLRRLDVQPRLRFKIDPTSSWDDGIFEGLRELDVVDSVDFKGLYVGTPVDQPADPLLYRRVVEEFPQAWIEDPALTPETDEILRPHRDRITWDAPIHSVRDIEALPFPPRMVNIKPSRVGPLRSLCEAYDYCAERGIGAYGGGQMELGPGRGQIQYLASLFHPDTPNDVAPGGYNHPQPPPGLPGSPLEPAPSPTGFRWGE
jgi:L-alanine-DL-glutamate epimerase-like enolase superfamily enzyme